MQKKRETKRSRTPGSRWACVAPSSCQRQGRVPAWCTGHDSCFPSSSSRGWSRKPFLLLLAPSLGTDWCLRAAGEFKSGLFVLLLRAEDVPRGTSHAHCRVPGALELADISVLDWLEVGLGGLLFLDAHGEIEFSCVVARPSQAAQCVSIVLCVPV